MSDLGFSLLSFSPHNINKSERTSTSPNLNSKRVLKGDWADSPGT